MKMIILLLSKLEGHITDGVFFGELLSDNYEPRSKYNNTNYVDPHGGQIWNSFS